MTAILTSTPAVTDEPTLVNDIATIRAAGVTSLSVASASTLGRGPEAWRVVGGDCLSGRSSDDEESEDGSAHDEDDEGDSDES